MFLTQAPSLLPRLFSSLKSWKYQNSFSYVHQICRRRLLSLLLLLLRRRRLLLIIIIVIIIIIIIII